MEKFLFIVFAPWLTFVVLAIIACCLFKLARKRRGIAFAFGVLVQMFIPDPQVEQTIKTVQVDKRIVKNPVKRSVKQELDDN
jgi:uncharacterized membrane protein YgaE (UPF0421/DUF939 family)